MSITSVTSDNPEAEYEPTAVDSYAYAPEPLARDTREQECQLIGFLLAHPDSASDDVLALPAEHMSNPGHEILWQIATERAYQGQEFDLVAIMGELRDQHQGYPSLPEQAKHYALEYGWDLVGAVTTTLADEITKGHVARETEATLLAAWQRLAKGQSGLAREVMSSVDPDAGARDQWVTLTDAWDAAKASAENPAATIPTPWPELNRYFEGGLRAGQVYVLAGTAGSGKTASAQGVIDSAASNGRTVAVFSLEMGKEDLARRQMSTSGGISMGEVMRTGLDMTQEAYATVDGVVDTIGDRVRIDDSEEITASQLRARARAAVRRYNAELVVVDYAQLVEHDNDKLNEREKIAEVVKSIARMAKELRVPVLLLAQPNRNASLQDRKLELTDLYGSGALEKFAGGVILLNRVPEEDDEGNKIPSMFVDFDIRKNRFGQNDVTVRMLSDLSRQRFEQVSKS